MSRAKNTLSRSHIESQLTEYQSDMQKQGEEVEKATSDVETTRGVSDDIEYTGTDEGGEAVEQHLEDAEAASTAEYEEGSDRLNDVRNEAEEHGDDLAERSDETESDAGRLRDAAGQLRGSDAKNPLGRALDSAERDVDALLEYARRAEADIEESRRLHEQYEAIVKAGKRT